MNDRLPIRNLPIVENWDCHSCGHCCRGTTIVLDDQDLKTLTAQRWEAKPQFKGQKITARETFLGGKTVLAHKADGSCIFLNDNERCTIHEQLGEAAKPAMCRMFPFQLVPLEKHQNLTVRHACPSASLAKGKPLEKKLKSFRRSDLAKRFTDIPREAPKLNKTHNPSWTSFDLASKSLARLLTNDRLPLVRRVVHGLRFCTLLDATNLSQHDGKTLSELLEIFEASAPEGVGELFRDRQKPSASTSALFRQAAVHTVRCLPAFPVANSWQERLRLLWLSFKFGRGSGAVPDIHPGLEADNFAQAEEPLGALPAEVLEPLNRFFESNIVSRKYAIVFGSRTVVESYRELALSFPTALWILRLRCGSRKPTQDDMVEVVVALDRAQGTMAISKMASLLANTESLEQSLAWYAR